MNVCNTPIPTKKELMVIPQEILKLYYNEYQRRWKAGHRSLINATKREQYKKNRGINPIDKNNNKTNVGNTSIDNNSNVSNTLKPLPIFDTEVSK